MSVLTKWGLAFACVLIPIWLWQSLSPDLPSSQRKPPVPVPTQLAEQQLAHGINLWREQEYVQARKAFAALGGQSLDTDLQALTNLYEYHATAFTDNQNADFIQHLSGLPKNCKQTLLFVTPDLESLAQAEQFRTRFAQDQRLSDLPICIYDVTWFDPENISCDKDWQQSGRLGCQLLSVAKKLKTLSFTHLVIFASEGKANVHNGIMFLDRHDTYDVFVHELAHFSGFIDEYPLSQSLAKRVCGGVDAPNMVFRHGQQTLADRQYWRSIGMNMGKDVFAARTCDNHPSQAFKASNQLTFMEYHDTAFIPPQYLTAWQKQLGTTPNQPSAHVNFAQLYEQSNNLTESQFWRAKYQRYLKVNTATPSPF